MKRTEVRFEQEVSLDHIDVVIRAPEKDETVLKLMEQLAGNLPRTLTVSDGGGNIRTIPEEEIILVSVDGKIVKIVTADGSCTTRQSLQRLESALDSQRFVRISRYEIVNLEKVRRYDFTLGGTLRLELEGGIETWASRRCIAAIRKRLMGKEW